MTTTVPLIYSFPEFLGVADAVADLVISAQNQTLYNTTDQKQIELIKSGQLKRPSINKTNSSISVLNQSNGNNNLNNNGSSNHNSNSNINSINNTPNHSPSHSQSGLNFNNNKSSSSNTSNLNPNTNTSSSISSSTSATTNNIEKNNKIKKEKKILKKQEIRFKIAISGGSLIKILNQGLLSKQDYIEWDKWDIYFADERLVPFNSPDSNYGQAKLEIFDHIKGDKKPKIFHIDETLIEDPQEAADDYEKQLIQNFAKKDSVKLPMFDLLLLGCAPDGHIASLFPNHGESLREKLAWCIPIENAPSGPKNRITLTIPVICHASRVAFVVEGLTKAPIIKTIMERPEKGLPSSIVNEGAAGRVSWFVDDAALNDLYDITKKKYKYLSIPEPK
ncbi:SOL1 [Candida pseudojiufengensis]|uniref:SOL1 n=1 Tax=Candida pseudojiufengensis TaxID=497109 RepID=UPI0022245E14|nr:SOL1 [Candida pseudojiufengensis]KAI5959136.1 SOL1 [Candida pseudojiufengensis]